MTTEEITKLENLLLSEDLEELNLRTKHFNIFNALKLQNNEIRHSNFLGWLMSPYETHELGDYFLKEFLKSAIKNYSTNENVHLCLPDIALKNFNNAEIRREYKNIDILVVDNDNKFVCIVENKTGTGEHDNQLFRYAQIVDKEFKKDYKKLYIFLTPPNSIDNFEELLKREDDEKDLNKRCDKVYYYIPMSYEQVFNAIEKTLKFNTKRLNPEVKTFIEHYKNMIEREIMKIKDENIVKLCKKIYHENKDAIDVLIETINSTPEDIDNILKNIIRNNNGLKLIENKKREKNWIRFISNSANIEKLQFAKKDWVDSKEIIMIEINNTTQKDIYADIIVRAVDETNSELNKKRDKILEIAKKTFNYETLKKGEYAHIYSVNLIEGNKYYDIASDEDLENRLTKALEKSKIIKTFEDFVNEVCQSI